MNKLKLKNKDIKNLIKKLLIIKKSFRISFKFNNIYVNVICNNKFFKKNELLIILKNKNLSLPIIKYYDLKYEYFKKDLSIDKTNNFNEYQINEYKKMFLYPIVNVNKDKGNKIDDFWNNIILNLKEPNDFKNISNKEINKVYRDSKESSEYGIYIETIVNLGNKKMSKKMYFHLIHYFMIPEISLNKLKSRNCTIRTTWNKSKHDKTLLNRLLNKELV